MSDYLLGTCVLGGIDARLDERGRVPMGSGLRLPVAARLDAAIRNGRLEQVVGAFSVEDPRYVDEAVKAFKAQLGATPITYEVARRIAERAIDMTNRAEQIVKARDASVLTQIHERTGGAAGGAWDAASLIGPAMYENPRAHARWHVDAIAKELGGRDPKSTPYERFDDLRKWAGESYRAVLAASQDKQIRDAVRAAFWSDVAAGVAMIPANAIAIIQRIPGAIVESATGLPLWAWTLILIGGVSLLGIAVFKILLSVAPAVAPVIAGRYLPARSAR